MAGIIIIFIFFKKQILLISKKCVEEIKWK